MTSRNDNNGSIECQSNGNSSRNEAAETGEPNRNFYSNLCVNISFGEFLASITVDRRRKGVQQQQQQHFRLTKSLRQDERGISFSFFFSSTKFFLETKIRQRRASIHGQVTESVETLQSRQLVPNASDAVVVPMRKCRTCGRTRRFGLRRPQQTMDGHLCRPNTNFSAEMCN